MQNRREQKQNRFRLKFKNPQTQLDRADHMYFFCRAGFEFAGASPSVPDRSSGIRQHWRHAGACVGASNAADVAPAGHASLLIDLQTRWKSMKMNEKEWKSMKINENRWKSMKIDGNQWKFASLILLVRSERSSKNNELNTRGHRRRPRDQKCVRNVVSDVHTTFYSDWRA